MNRKKVIIIVSVVLFVIILAFLIWVWFNRFSQVDNTAQKAANEPQKLPVLTNTQTQNNEVPTPAPLSAALKTVAITFAERFGSYSNQGNFENLNDLESLMTVKMKAVTDDFITRQTQTNESYYGITTMALSARVTSLDESFGQAEIFVSTQRQESKGNTNNPRVFYQNITLKLVNTGEGWKVDEATWQ